MCRWEGYDEMPDVYRQHTPKARKQHTCDECKRTIEVGEVYQNTFTVYDGKAFTFSMCMHCRKAADWLIRECGGYVFQQVVEELVEHCDDYPHVAEGLVPLIEGIKAGWKKDGALMPWPALPECTTEKEAVL